MPSYSDPSNCLDEKKRALLERIDGLERWEWKKTLRGGFSGADVLLAWVTHTGRAHSLDVFKFDTAKKSQKEHENCKRYVAPYLNRTNVVQIKAFIRGEVGSLIVYDCGSFDGHLETFAEHYGSVLTPAHTIERLFLKVLEPWYTNSTGVAQDIGGWVSGRVTRIARAIRDELPKLPIDAARAGLHVAPLGRTLPNPLYSAHLTAPACSVRVPVGIIHGDLNARNILLINQGGLERSGVVTKPIWGDERDTLIQEICLIDYARTRKGSLMADLAKLETEIKFHLLVLERGIDWQLLLGFEEAVSRELALRSIAARDAPRDNAELQKAFSAIAMIRDVALKLLARHPDLDPASYWAQLYVNTLQTLTHRDSTIGQHRYAAVSAAMIMERQLSGVMKYDTRTVNVDRMEMSLDLIEGEVGRTGAAAEVIATGEVKPRNEWPYKGLDYYDAEDRDIFFGRARDVKELTERILSAHRVTVLSGRSGVGKSSILGAGLTSNPTFSHYGNHPIYVRCVRPVISTIKAHVSSDIARYARGFEIATDDSLSSILIRAEERLGRGIVLLIDQLDEILQSESQGYQGEVETVAAQVEKCLKEQKLRTRFVFAVREESLGDLTKLEGRVPDIYTNVYILRNLARSDARAAITAPAQAFGVRFEPKLVEELIRDLSREGGVEPPPLQIVCSKLFDSRGTANVITLERYRELGGLATILGQHLEETLGGLPRDLNRSDASSLLRAMVSESGRVISCSVSDLSAATSMNRVRLERYVGVLGKMRLIRAVDTGRGRRYELVHEYLAEKIQGWERAGGISTEQIQDLRAVLVGEIARWRLSGRRYVPSRELLQSLGLARNALAIEDEDTAEFLLRSHVTRRIDARHWFRRGVGESSKAEQIAKLLMRVQERSEEDRRLRMRAIEILGDIGSSVAVDALLALLEERDRGVRHRAIVALGRIGSNKAITDLVALTTKQGRDWGSRWRAVWALGAMAAKKERRGDLRSAIQPLMTLVGGARVASSVRWRAAWALGELKAREAVTVLSERKLSDRSAHVRKAAERALAEIAATPRS